MATSSRPSDVNCTCTICCDIFKDPVVLLCGHSFCKDCLQEWWRQSQLKTCPLCKDIFKLRQPPRNLALKDVSDAVRQERSQRGSAEEVCSVHGEKLKLYCQDDQQPVCVVCRDAKRHKNHNCVPINEAAEDHKTQLKKTLMHLKSKLGIMNVVKLKNEEMASHIQLQAQQTETGIKEEFQKFYQFLQAEEAARIAAVRNEAMRKSLKIKIIIVNLTTEISTLSKTIEAVKDKLNDKDSTIVLNFMSTMERAQCTLADPVSPSGALMDEAKHLGNLLFNVWSKMKNMIKYTPVILDPNTCRDIISENFTRITKRDYTINLPDNPERTNDVLGSEGIICGRHHWDVEVGGEWSVGVTAPIDDVKWGIYICVCTGILREITPHDYVKVVLEDTHSYPKRIRVKIDYDQGQLTFYDLDRKVVVYSMTHKFTKPVFPFFRANAKILPAEFSVVDKMHR